MKALFKPKPERIVNVSNHLLSGKGVAFRAFAHRTKTEGLAFLNALGDGVEIAGAGNAAWDA